MENLNHWKSCINCGYKIVISSRQLKIHGDRQKYCIFFISSEIALFLLHKGKGSFEHWTILNLLLTPMMPLSVLRSVLPVLPRRGPPLHWLPGSSRGPHSWWAAAHPLKPGPSFSLPVSPLFGGCPNQEHMIEWTTASWTGDFGGEGIKTSRFSHCFQVRLQAKETDWNEVWSQ